MLGALFRVWGGGVYRVWGSLRGLGLAGFEGF